MTIRNPAVPILIAENDPRQLHKMRELVKELKPDWIIVCCATTVEEVIRGVEDHLPQLLVLDMQLSQDGKTEWLHHIPADLAMIFVADDRQSAVDAFDYEVVDVLVRPHTKRRTLKAFERAQWCLARQSFGVGSGGPVSPPMDLDATHLRWIKMSRGDDLILVEPSDVIYMVADIKYTKLITSKGEGMVRVSLSTLMEHLDARQFVRVNRSAAVNLSYVSSIRKNDLGYLNVLLRERPEQLRVSKLAGGIFRYGIL